MGWASGTDIAVAMGTAIKQHVKDPKVRRKLYQELKDTLESSDWDCQYDAKGIDPIFDKVLTAN